MRSLLDGEKLTYEGRFYRCDRAKLYSPPLHRVPIWMACGGRRSTVLAATMADGIITSVKDPGVSMQEVVDPARRLADHAGRPAPTIVATRWSIFAHDQDEAWQAIYSWRGLRAPGRLEAVDPADLRERADGLPRDEVLASYPIVSGGRDVIATYLPLITELNADVVTLSMAAVDQEGLIAWLGSEVLPALREAGGR